MAKSDKVAAVAELVERFRAADAVLLTEYRGLTVGQLKQLRRGLGENATYAVAKNSLTGHACARKQRGEHHRRGRGRPRAQSAAGQMREAGPATGQTSLHPAARARASQNARY